MDIAERKQLLKRRILVSCVVIIVALGTGLLIHRFLSESLEAPATESKARTFIAVRTLDAERGPYQETLTGYGLARALRHTMVPAEIPGTVRWVSPSLEAGLEVAAGDILVRLDSRDFEDAKKSAQARVAQAKASQARLDTDRKSLEKQVAIARENLATARRELSRLSDLEGEEVVSKSLLDQQRINTALREREVIDLEGRISSNTQEIQRIAAQLAGAQADLSKTENDLARTQVKAPYAGRIVQRNANVGNQVQPGTPLFELVDLSRIEIPIALAASRYGEVQPGAKVSVSLGSRAEPVWKGKVSRISPTVNDSDRTFFAYLELENKATSSAIPPGAFVVARIQGKRHEKVFAIPRIAFVEDRVFVAKRDQGSSVEALAEARALDIFRFLPYVALVREGLAPGEEIIISNLEEVADQTRVRVVEEP